MRVMLSQRIETGAEFPDRSQRRQIQATGQRPIAEG